MIITHYSQQNIVIHRIYLKYKRFPLSYRCLWNLSQFTDKNVSTLFAFKKQLKLHYYISKMKCSAFKTQLLIQVINKKHYLLFIKVWVFFSNRYCIIHPDPLKNSEKNPLCVLPSVCDQTRRSDPFKKILKKTIARPSFRPWPVIKQGDLILLKKFWKNPLWVPPSVRDLWPNKAFWSFSKNSEKNPLWVPPSVRDL